MPATKSSESSISVQSFAANAGDQLIPVTNSLSYCVVAVDDDVDLQRLVHDPASATPPIVKSILPQLRIVVVPYLAKSHGKAAEGPLLVFKKPPESRRIFAASVEHGREIFIFLAAKDEDVADYHDSLYYELASLLVDRADDDLTAAFRTALRDELKADVRGEVDDASWKLKDQLLSRQADPARNTKTFQSYARESMVDTLTLYLHGLCCDLDVEAGPRQLPSGHLRKRLELLRDLFPPPTGVSVFPEELA